MSQINQFSILNLDNNIGLKFHYAESYRDNITINSINFAIPGQTADKNFVGNFGGFSRFIEVDFVLHNDGTNKAIGAGSAITISQQIDRLMDNIVQGQSTGFVNVVFRITVFRDGTTKTYDGMIEDVSINATSDDGNFAKGSIRIREGGN